jgi:hypothetical protein
MVHPDEHQRYIGQPGDTGVRQVLFQICFPDTIQAEVEDR